MNGAAVPASVAVLSCVGLPSLLGVNVTPAGSDPVSKREETGGKPLGIICSVPGWPTVKVARSGLLNAGACSTVRVKF